MSKGNPSVCGMLLWRFVSAHLFCLEYLEISRLGRATAAALCCNLDNDMCGLESGGEHVAKLLIWFDEVKRNNDFMPNGLEVQCELWSVYIHGQKRRFYNGLPTVMMLCRNSHMDMLRFRCNMRLARRIP